MLSGCLAGLFNRGESASSGNQSSEPTTDTGTTTPSSTDPSDPNIYPETLTITGKSSIVIGETATLTATYTPSDVTNKTITWYSSNTSAVTITNKGKITGKASGSSVITAEMKGPNDTKVRATHEVTVGVPSATGVTLDKTTLNMSYNKTAQLTATVNPSAANQAVTWSTSNNSVASVSNTGLVTSKAVTGNAVITATSVDGGFTASCTVNVKEVTGTTVMIYMCGADLESGSPESGYGYLSSGCEGLASMDLDEILSVNGQPDNVNIVVETGGAKKWAKSNINKNYLERWEIRNKSMDRKAQLTKASMGKSATLQSFLEWGFENYPSEQYGLILWNHGGAMSGCCFDENYSDDALTPKELYDAVTAARNSKGITDKLEWITYDACLMAVQDVAEYNSYNFNYMLCSQESESGYGYDYDAWLPTLYNNPSVNGGELLEVIGHTFIEEERGFYQSWYGSRWKQYFDQTQSVYDLSKVAAYKTAFENLATSINNVIGTNDSKAASLGNLIYSAQKYGQSEDEYGDAIYPFDIFDVKSTLSKLSSNSSYSSLSSQISAVNNAVDQLVIYEEHGEATTGCGICLFCPMSGYSYPYDYNSSATLSNFTNWKVVANKVFWACYNS